MGSAPSACVAASLSGFDMKNPAQNLARDTHTHTCMHEDIHRDAHYCTDMMSTHSMQRRPASGDA